VVNIPNIPALAYQGFHVQAAILNTSGVLKTTNDLSFAIQP